MRRTSAGAAFLVTCLAGALPVFAADLNEKLAPCLGCHGAEGQSATENVPSLGAQAAPYTVIQLFMFREKLRAAEPMNEMAKDLSDDDLQAIADFCAKQPAPKPPANPEDPPRLERDQALVEQNHCNVCHRPDFSGQNNVPRLADQREDYLLKTLRDYKSGARRGYDASMAEVLQPVDDAQLVEFAYYLSRSR
jgi:cytochrome c553